MGVFARVPSRRPPSAAISDETTVEQRGGARGQRCTHQHTSIRAPPPSRDECAGRAVRPAAMLATPRAAAGCAMGLVVPPLAVPGPGAAQPSGKEAAAARRLDAFEIVCLVGKGGFGKVMLVRLKGGKAGLGEWEEGDAALYAMKVMKKDVLAERNALRDAQAERDILALLGGKLGGAECPFIVRLHAAFQSPTRLYLVMDFAAGGEIMWHLRRQAMLSEEAARFYAAELLLALEFLHERRILHRDIKPENVLLAADGHLLLTDFGLAKDLGDDPPGSDFEKRKHSWCGSEDYMAPEIIAREEHAGAPADWWAFGVFLYDCLVGHPPFSPLHEMPLKGGKVAPEKKTRKKLHDRILKAKFKLPGYLTSQCHALIRALLTRDPDKRLTDPAAIRAHPWFKSVDWDAARAKQLVPPIIPPVAGSGPPTACFSPSLTQTDHSAPHSPLALSSAAPPHPVSAAVSIPIPVPVGAAPVPADGSGFWHGFSFVAPGMEVHFELAAPPSGDAVLAAAAAAAPVALHSTAWGSPLAPASPGVGFGTRPTPLPPFALHASPSAASAGAGAAFDPQPSTPPLLTPCASPSLNGHGFPAVELQLAAEVAEFSLDAEEAVKVDENTGEVAGVGERTAA